MNRTQLEHVIRASADICDDGEIIIIGSQAILGPFPEAPVELQASMEADVIPRNKPERAIEIDGALGELSPFHTTFGYYAHGVDEETAVLAEGWKDRLIPIRNANTNDCTGWCLAPVDIAISKLAAGRPKDIRFVTDLLRHQLLAVADICPMLAGLPPETGTLVEENLRRCEAASHQ